MRATHSADPAHADLIIEDDDHGAAPDRSAQENEPWRILIVDDDVDVHVVTKFALSNTSFRGRRLSYLHAYTGKEALDLLRTTPDIALVLLDVIMETPDAGLRVARQIRDDLHNDLVRIVLRTGQPGQAFEHSIIVDYDINDFWCKADLTTRKLFTTVIASLRAYAELAECTAVRHDLAAQLAGARNLLATADQLVLALTLDSQGRIVDANDRFCVLVGIAREALVGTDLRTLHPLPFPEPLAQQLLASLARDGNWSGDLHTSAGKGIALDLRCAVRALNDGNGAPRQYVAVATALERAG
jgi:PAS domain S-box-containing protein